MKSFILAAVCLLSASLAMAETDWTKNAVPIEPGSEIHKHIDEITLEIFNSPLKKTLCDVYGNAASAYHSLGVSAETAVALFKGCPSRAAANTKVLSKRYYLSFDKEPRLDSWTDYGNRTYIFMNGELTRNHLKSVILHEIAMSTDAKTNMYLTGYFNYRNQKSSSRLINLGNLSKREDTLRQAFNMSTWGPLSRAFATIRAFQIELRAEGKELNFQEHHRCASFVRDVFYKTQYLPEPPKSNAVDSVAEMLADAVDSHMTPQTREQEIEVLNFVLHKDLTLKDLDNRTVSFCQFMTTPLLTGRSLYTFLSAGPRPRLTGGSGGQGRDDGDKNISGETILKQTLEKKNFSIKDQRLIDAVERLKNSSSLRLR